MKWLFSTDESVAPLVIRLALGAVMLPHGAQKVLGWFGGHGFSATLQHFSGMGIPLAVGVLVIVAEFFGSLGLIAGLLTRFSAFGIACVMVGAVLMVHLPHGLFMNWTGKQGGEGFEYHILVIGMSIALMIAGGGRFSVDRMLARKR